MADNRIHVTKEALLTLENIDNLNFLELGNKGDSPTQRIDQYLVATAIGADTLPTDLKNRGIALIREESLKEKDKAILIAFFLATLFKNEEDIASICNLENALKHSESYANTGFISLESSIQNTNEDILLKQWFSSLDKYHREFFPEQYHD